MGSARWLGTQRGSVLGARHYPGDEWVTPPPPGVGAVVTATAKSIALTPGTGGTLAPWVSGYPAWLASTAHANPPRVMLDGYRTYKADVGRSYELNRNGTTGAVGPSGTTLLEVDGSARWGYLGDGNLGQLNSVSGGKLITCAMRGNQANSPSETPTDVSGGQTPSVLAGGAHTYASFTQSASICHLIDCPVGYTGHQVTFPYGLYSGGYRDEISALLVSLSGVGALHTWSYVERAGSTGNLVTTAPITTTVPTFVLVIACFNGNVIATGNRHVAVPQGTLKAIQGCHTLLALDAAGYIQSAAYYDQVAATSNLAYSIQTALGEGGQLYVLAFEAAA